MAPSARVIQLNGSLARGSSGGATSRTIAAPYEGPVGLCCDGHPWQGGWPEAGPAPREPEAQCIPGDFEHPRQRVLALVVVACGPAQPDPTSAAIRLGPQPQMADSMNVGVHLPAPAALGIAFQRIPTDLPLHSLHPNGSLWDGVVRRFVYSGVYRFDDTLSPVPDLARSCARSAPISLVVTCVLREATFHDGTPVTADDVAFTYQLLISDACRMPNWCTVAGGHPAGGGAGHRPAYGRVSIVRTGSGIHHRSPARRDDRAARTRRERVCGVRRSHKPARTRSPSENSALECRRWTYRTRRRAHPLEAGEEALLAEAELAIADIGLALRSRDAYASTPGGAFDCLRVFRISRARADRCGRMR